MWLYDLWGDLFIQFEVAFYKTTKFYQRNWILFGYQKQFIITGHPKCSLLTVVSAISWTVVYKPPQVHLLIISV